MAKRNLWPLFFFAIFGFTLYMIGWTIYQSTKIETHEDDAFFSTYHIVDQKFNEIAIANEKSNAKYEMYLVNNNKQLPLDYKDAFLRQAGKNKDHADLFVDGINSIKFVIKNKATGEIVSNATIKAIFTSSTSHKQKQIIEKYEFKDGGYIGRVKIDGLGNYNFTGEITIGEDKGYFFFKTNAIKQ